MPGRVSPARRRSPRGTERAPSSSTTRCGCSGGWNPDDEVHFPGKGDTNSEVWTSTGRRLDARQPPRPLGRKPYGGLCRSSRPDVGRRRRPDPRHYQNDVWASADGVRWAKVLDRRALGPAHPALHGCAYQDKIWVMGGQTLPAIRPGAEVFTTTSGAARTARPGPGSSPSPVAAAGDDRRKRRFHGPNLDPRRRHLRDAGDARRGISTTMSGAPPTALHWDQNLDHAPWKPRQYHDVAVFDDRLWVLEGWSGANRYDVWWSEDGRPGHEVPGDAVGAAPRLERLRLSRTRSGWSPETT